MDHLVAVVRAFAARLAYLDQELQPERAGLEESHAPDAAWLSEARKGS